MSAITFTIEKRLPKFLGRAGRLETSHGVIETPAFVTVGTKATVKALTIEQIRDAGAEVVLANTYHLYFEPGEKIVKAAGGLGAFMGWNGPTMTDSGGFQAFSLGAAFEKGVGKISKRGISQEEKRSESLIEERSRDISIRPESPLATITEDGVSFKSYKDGSTHLFTPERSIDIQHDIGADIIFAFDECTSPDASEAYQKEALERTNRWAKRSLKRHQELQESERGSTFREIQSRTSGTPQALFGIVQGGRVPEFRRRSATFTSSLPFDGFGIGGSFDKKDIGTAIEWVNEILPEEKPRHLLGIGEPLDLFEAVQNGCDLFDCVTPTRLARNASLYTTQGKINILNAEFRSDLSPVDGTCRCYTCLNYTKAYLAHLFRSKELLSNTLASIHNLTFIISLVKGIRQAILEGTFSKMKEDFEKRYLS
ncbi:MAG: hypothetical protein A2836_01190 [Candidatus Taylorbacteria bacterium RIFCSPHIGHO2_01_FULL_45_63]|uniref:Queuine tRNA-ribosyltransferase n=1 Tax=Candidatus Taylorbacteria bacterium RIFCSPHIGHO2_02_FULL_45_35 TaxID=1802311 RepID=A0A1G2MN99_9BACT|nr:MAG: hypothetical protein A2836_01190 [Candidatus Taylorbacteria bacterium RIFCSPHIGHO2_01_FULL_45_63]OHA25370.1 MAG: hypothetical protein A3D56_04035 [Candidatus Taylorbacteria bacterium RIFCSPHIGHO2_02_FULL_45_35]OHA35092.1 MAG: hypothetical protein A3A22_03790 [Candidatus Taylorbacteria bacterium RIFCSPLOWO2_01_FULL_45_34b]